MLDITLKTLATAVLKTKQDPRILSLDDTSAVPVPIEPEPILPLDPTVNITLVRTPNSGMKGLVRIRQQLGLGLTIGELLSKAQHLPLPLLEGVSLSLYQQRCAVIQAEEGCIEVSDQSSLDILDIC